MAYDCTADVLEHKRKVAHYMNEFANNLEYRAIIHDDSKLRSPEKETFDKYTPKLKEVEFGSDAYNVYRSEMSEGLSHHYAVNSHHPEHYSDRVAGMNLLDLIEMVCDWRAAAETGDQELDLDYLARRFGLAGQLVSIIGNTIEED